MNRTVNQLGPPPLEGKDERWAVVLRVAASRQFTKAPQLHDILIYICHRALSDPTATIKEHEIGCNALGRRPDFNPNEDNIVRVQISHLRKKLDEYFATDGKNEPLQITVPRGAYVPRFEPKMEIPAELPVPAPVAPPTEMLPPAAAEPPLPRGVYRRPFPWTILLATTTGVLAIACLYLAFRPTAARTLAPPPARQDAFWSRLFDGGRPAGVVVADSCLVMLQDILHTDLTLPEYLSHQYPDDLLRKVPDQNLRSALQLLASRQYTSLGDLTISARIVELSLQFGANRAPVRYSRHVNIRDFKTEKLILVGSRRSVPWVQLFEPQMNFYFDEDPATHRFYFRNRKPQPGEAATYFPTERAGAADTYSVITLLPNLGNTGPVLILCGITMVASEAAGEFVARKEFAQELERLLGGQGAHEKYFEILLKTRVVAGASRNSQIVAHRVIQVGDSGN